MTTKVHKITIMVVDHDGLGAEGVADVLEGARYPNHCIRPDVVEMESREVEWDDSHPLNYAASAHEAFRVLFGKGEP